MISTNMAQLQVRRTIQLLATILTDNGAIEITAESFRLAKFNKDEATQTFWILLFDLLYFIKYRIMDEVPVKAVQDLSSEEIVVYVKRELNKLGFLCHELSSLPNDMSHGSRELLLATGWLLCKESVIDKFMQTRGSDIGEDTALFHLKVEGDNSEFLKKTENFQNSTDKVNYLLWLNGKLHMKMKQLYALQIEKTKLIQKVHSATQGVSLTPERNHLSVLEVYLLRHPDALKKMLKLLDDDNNRLQNLLKWKEKEDQFWKWMESVLDLKLQENGEAQSNNVQPIHMDILKGMDSAYLRLQKSISRYEDQLELLERLIIQKTSSVSQSQLDDLKHSIDAEIDFQKDNLAAKKSKTPGHPQIQTILAFVNPVKSDKATESSNQSYKNELDALIDLESQMDSLQLKVNGLEDALQNRQDSFKDELTKLSEQFQQGVCIPPLCMKYPT